MFIEEVINFRLEKLNKILFSFIIEKDYWNY